MRLDKLTLSDIGYWVLVICAFVTTLLVARREFFQESASFEVNEPAIYVEGWEDALASGIRIGLADAPVQVVEFVDFQCPACARFEKTAQSIRDKYPDQVAFTLAHLPLTMHESAETAARVAECAYQQGRFGEMSSLLFAKQQAFGLVPWTEFARQSEILDLEQFDSCISDTQPIARIEQGRTIAEKLDVRGTPTILINGWKLPVIPTMEHFDKIVENVMNDNPPTKGMEFVVASSPRR